MADLRRCIGSTRFGIGAHDAPVDEFPSQTSQKDGLGRMCNAHWNAYTAGLARDAKARKAEAEPTTAEGTSQEGDAAAPDASAAEAVEPAPKRSRRGASPVAPGEGEAA